VVFFTAPTHGHVKINVHDEAYARVHLGFMGVNIDFFLARVCFKGGAEYSINILQVQGVMKTSLQVQGVT
jgi:hypothetical protein